MFTTQKPFFRTTHGLCQIEASHFQSERLASQERGCVSTEYRVNAKVHTVPETFGMCHTVSSDFLSVPLCTCVSRSPAKTPCQFLIKNNGNPQNEQGCLFTLTGGKLTAKL